MGKSDVKKEPKKTKLEKEIELEELEPILKNANNQPGVIGFGWLFRRCFGLQYVLLVCGITSSSRLMISMIKKLR